MAIERVIAARQAYFERFGDEGPRLFGLSDGWMAQVLTDAVKRGEPIPEDFDWYVNVPPGAVV